MKFFLTFLATNIFLLNILLSQKYNKTTVTIIGVSHTETKFMNTDSLLHILQKIKPDVILDEMQSPSGFYTKEKTLREIPTSAQIRMKLGIGKKLTPEKMVLYEYRKIDSDIIIRPFDIYIEDRNKYVRDEKKWEKKFYEIVNNPSHSNTFSEYQKNLFLEYVRLNNLLYDLTQKSYFDMNQPHIPDSLRKMEAIESVFFMSVLDSLAVAGSLKPQYEKNQLFWKKRNEKMASNIIDYVQEFSGKRIVVLTGLLHKHYLLDLLNQAPQKDLFKIVEFYDPVLTQE